jgi:tetratricopeptide (TPR) repeat protein
MRDKKQVKRLSGPGSERPKAASAISARRGVDKTVTSQRLAWDQYGRLALLLVAVTLVAYLPALLGQFVWDDDHYVTNNLLLRSLKGLWQIWSVPGATPQYYPLTFTSFWVDYHLWQLNPLGYHLINVLLQALNAILLWTILRRLNVPGAWLAAAVFAVHPVNVESVAWITERKNMLAGFFFLGSALACLRFWLPNLATADGRATKVSETSAASLGEWKFYWLALCLYLCALLAKTAIIALPGAVLVVVWWKSGKVGWRELFPLTPFLAVGMAMGLLTVWVEKHFVHPGGREWTLSFLERCLIAGRAIWFYLGKLAWPHPLMFVYPRWEIHVAQPLAYLPVLALMVVLFILWLNRKSWARPMLVALVYFLALLFPGLGFFNLYFFRYSFVADHYQYFAAIGPLTLAAAGISLTLGRFGKRSPFLKPLFCGTLLLILGVLTWRQCGMYTNLETLWQKTLARNPDSWLAHGNLGLGFYHEGRTEEAMEHYRKAIQIDPNDYATMNNLGIALAAQGQFDEAIETYRRAVQINPNFSEAMNNLGIALATRGRSDEAIENFRKVIQNNPNYYEALDNLGVALASRGQFDEAIKNFHQAIRINSNRPETFYHLGMALGHLGRKREAMAQYREALRLDPNLTGALINLAWILASNPDDDLRNGAAAVRLADRACELTHYNEPLYLGTLAAAYAEAGRFPEAVSAAEKAEQLATAAGSEPLAEKSRLLLEIVRSGKPYHEPAPVGQ